MVEIKLPLTLGLPKYGHNLPVGNLKTTTLPTLTPVERKRKMNMLRSSFFILTFFLLQSVNINAQSISTDSLVNSFIREQQTKYNIPGIAVAVISKGQIIKATGYGYINLDNKIPATPTSIFAIASMDKQITATAIMMLYEQGKLKLENTLDMYFDSIPDFWKTIAVKNLLSHTSGLPDEVSEKYNGRLLISYSTGMLLQYIKKQTPEFKPGEGWVYSDANFFLLQLIVEKVSGMTYGEFLNTKMLGPLGMMHTATISPFKVVHERATPYWKSEDESVIVNTYRYVDFGPLYNDIGTSVTDFAKWDNAITYHKLLKQSTYDLMWTPFILNDGRQVSNLADNYTTSAADASYGYGWVLHQFRGHRRIYHSGYTGTSVFRLPDDSLTVIYFSNLTDEVTDYDADITAMKIADYYLANRSFHLLQPKKDPDIKQTTYLQNIISNLTKEKVDSTAFTSDYFALLKQTLKTQEQRTKVLGEFKSLEYIDADKGINGNKSFYYKVNFSKRTRYYIVITDKKNKIVYLCVER
ncbi:MAG: serine hydrolase [Ferruginibacter sp.]